MTAERDHLQALRLAEIDAALALLGDKRGRLLEIGGGDGFAARHLAQKFASVTSVDVALSPDPLHAVELYDGEHLPFPDGSFDVAFSSHVMEHVEAFDALQAEIARVLAPDGIAVHVMPSAVWRLWTTLGHYAALPRLVIATLARKPMPGASASGLQANSAAGRSPLWWLRRVVAATRHGSTGTMLGELSGFAARTWKQRFERAGWTVAAIRPVGLFYTGYLILGARLGLPARRRLAEALGAASIVYRVIPSGRA